MLANLLISCLSAFAHLAPISALWFTSMLTAEPYTDQLMAETRHLLPTLLVYTLCLLCKVQGNRQAAVAVLNSTQHRHSHQVFVQLVNSCPVPQLQQLAELVTGMLPVLHSLQTYMLSSLHSLHTHKRYSCISNVSGRTSRCNKHHVR